MMDILGIIAVVLLVINTTLLLLLLKKASKADAVSLASRLDAFEKAQERTEQAVREEVARNRNELSNATREQRQELAQSIKTFGDGVDNKLEAVRITVESKLQTIQTDNARQLEQMRQTVDEKLQGTLEKRLGESFKQVSERLEMVHKGLGEMQSLATGVGDLKKVLTNPSVPI